nr:DUF4845 domain-containing protein [Xylella fastidiosa]
MVITKENLVKRTQYGITLRSTLIFTIIIFFTVHFAIHAFLVYQKYYSLQTAMKSLKKELVNSDLDPSTIEELFLKRINIDSFDNVKKENIKFEKIRDGWKMKVNFEILRKRIGNMDLVGTFDSEQDLTSRDIK